MKRAARNVLCVLLVLCCTPPRATAQTRPAAAEALQPTTSPTASPATRVVLAGTQTDYWLAIARPTEDKDHPISSTVYYRGLGSDKFGVVARFPDRVTALGRYSSRALVLLNDGQWLSVWPGGSAGGAPLPAGGRVLALAGDDRSTWAVGAVRGGLDAARAATRPSTRRASSTNPSDASDPDLVLLRLRGEGSGWTPVAALPSIGAVPSPANISLLVTRASVAVSVNGPSGDTTVFVLNRTGEAGPTDGGEGTVRSLPFAGSDVDLFEGARGDAMAWVRVGGQASGAFVALDDPGRETGRLVVGSAAAATARVGSALGYLRLVSVDKDVVEQRLAWDGKPLGKSEPLQTLPAADEAPPWSRYVEGVIVALLALTIFASYRQRDAVRDALNRKDRPRPAKIWVRLCAAIVDGVPILVGVVVVYLRSATGDIAVPDFATTVPGLIGIGVYVLHTTISELLFRRTLGKLIFALKVVDLKGERPTVGAVLTRNALRLIDLALLFPLLFLLVLFSPLRQRAGDAAAGTVVVDLAAPTMTDAPDAEE